MRSEIVRQLGYRNSGVVLHCIFLRLHAGQRLKSGHPAVVRDERQRTHLCVIEHGRGQVAAVGRAGVDIDPVRFHHDSAMGRVAVHYQPPRIEPVRSLFACPQNPLVVLIAERAAGRSLASATP